MDVQHEKRKKKKKGKRKGKRKERKKETNQATLTGLLHYLYSPFKRVPVVFYHANLY